MVGIAKQHGIESRSAGHGGNVVEVHGMGRPIRHDAIVHLIRPGVQRGSTGRAGRRLGIVRLQEKALAGECIEGRCRHERMTDDSESIPAKLIERYE